MNSNPAEIVERLRRFKDRLKKEGVKATHQRLEIYQAIAASEEHPGVEAIFRRVREKLPTISLDTVYRTLWMLLDLGLIATLGPPRGRLRFDADTGSHHHFVCSKCGLIRDFFSPALDRLRIPEFVKAWGTAEKAQVEVRGVCLSCLNQKAKDPKGASSKERRKRNG